MASRPPRPYGNLVQSAVLLGGMAGLLALIGWILAGAAGVTTALVAGVFFVVMGRNVPPTYLLQMIGASPLSPLEAPALFAAAEELSRRAGLTHVPGLYVLPANLMQSFTAGARAENAVIVLTDGLLRGLSLREAVGVLAHEIGHIQNRDVPVMSLADAVTRMTRTLSFFGILLILLNLPLFLMGQRHLPWLVPWLLAFAPMISTLLQLALSRTREFDADYAAVQLTGDPAGLASALTKMELEQRSLWRRLLLPGAGEGVPSLLRTHPLTEERVERVLGLRPTGPPLPRELLAEVPVFAAGRQGLPRLPGWRTLWRWR